MNRVWYISLLIGTLLAISPWQSYGEGETPGRDLLGEFSDLHRQLSDLRLRSSDLRAQCEQALQEARTSCEAEEQSEDEKEVSNLMKRSADLAQQAASMGRTLPEQCDLAMKIMGVGGFLSTLKGGTCQFAIGSCSSACSDPIAEINGLMSSITSRANELDYSLNQSQYEQIHSDIAILRGNEANCKKFQKKAVANLAQAQNYAQNMLQTKACADMAKTASTNLPTTDGTVNCNDAVQARTPTCICEKNPRDPICTAGMKAGTGSSYSSSGGSKLGGSNDSDLGLDMDDLGKTNPRVAGNGESPGSNSVGQASSGGPGGGGGGGGGSFGGGDDGGGAAGGGSQGVIQGYSGGNGSFNYGRGPASVERSQASSGLRGLAAKFNLGRFFPKDQSMRGLAGMNPRSMIGEDGITGPLGPTIWEKVSRQYQKKKGELLPP